MQQDQKSKCRICAVFWVIILAVNLGILSYFIAWEFVSLKQYRVATAIRDGKRSVVSLEHTNNAQYEGLAFTPAPQSPQPGSSQEIAQDGTLSPETLSTLEPSGAPMQYADATLEKLEADIMLEAKINPLLNTKHILTPTVTVIVGGLGISNSTTELAFTLPSQITLGFSPYANNLPQWLDQADKQGNPVVLQLPLQTSHYPADNPGPYGLLDHTNKRTNSKKLQKLIGLTDKPIPFYTTTDEIITSNNIVSATLIETFKTHDIPLIYSKQDNTSFIDYAKEAAIALTTVDFVIDDILSEHAIRRQLAKATEIAHYKGHVTVMGHAYPLTIATLKDWANSQKDVALLGFGVPKSTIDAPSATAGNNSTDKKSTHAAY